MSETTAADNDRQEASLTLRALADRRVAAMLLLGMAAGLPFFLIFDTLSAWLRQSGVSLQTITVFALAPLSYARHTSRFLSLWSARASEQLFLNAQHSPFSPSTLNLSQLVLRSMKDFCLGS